MRAALTLLVLQGCLIVTEQNVGDLVARAGCERARECGDDAFEGLYGDDVEACVEVWSDLLGGTCQQTYCRFDAVEAQACLPAMRSTTCDGNVLDEPACQQVWVDCDEDAGRWCLLGEVLGG